MRSHAVFHVDIKREDKFVGILELSKELMWQEFQGYLISLADIVKDDIKNTDSEIEFLVIYIWVLIVIHVGMDPPEEEISMECGFIGG